MRYMVMVKGNKESEQGVLPDQEMLATMGKFNDELAKAGVLLAADGLQDTAKGFKVRYSGSNRSVIDGPFSEAKEVVAGYWVWQVKSKEEAIEWAKRIPFFPSAGEEAEVEIRQVFEAEDFGDPTNA